VGHKVSPLVLRIGYIENWRAQWFGEKKDFAIFVVEDQRIRNFIKKKFAQASIARIIIERVAEDKIKVIIYTARPGVIIGRRGADIDKLREELGKITKREITIDPREIKNPAIEPELVAQNVAFQLEKRVAFRRAMKRAMDSALGAGAKGIKLRVSGRLNGAEMARTEGYREGRMPLHTFRARIEYGFAEALTTYGIIGVKAWIFKGEVIKEVNRQSKESAKKTVAVEK